MGISPMGSIALSEIAPAPFRYLFDALITFPFGTFRLHPLEVRVKKVIHQ